MRQFTLSAVGFALLLGISTVSAGQAAQDSDAALRREQLRQALPENFPLPAGAERRALPDDPDAVACRVAGTTQMNLMAFFKRELPSRGYQILAQNPPRVHNDDSPVTLIVQRERRKHVLQLSKDAAGNAEFLVR